MTAQFAGRYGRRRFLGPAAGVVSGDPLPDGSFRAAKSDRLLENDPLRRAERVRDLPALGPWSRRAGAARRPLAGHRDWYADPER